MCIITRKSAQNKGIATILLNEVMKQIKTKQIIMAGWKSTTSCNIKKLAFNFQFKPFKEIKAIGKRYKCPICGFPCECLAIIYHKENKLL